MGERIASQPVVVRLVSTLMTRGVVTVSSDTPVPEAMKAIDRAGVSHLVVARDGQVEAVVCECDLEDAPGSATVAEVMTVHPLTVSDDATVAEAARVMVDQEVSCLPVMHEGRLAGVITMSDLARAGVVDLPVGCAACGSQNHVRCERHGRYVGFCLACQRRSEPPDSDDDLGGG